MIRAARAITPDGERAAGVVLRDGRIAGELPAGSDEESVMKIATGQVDTV